MPDRNTIAGDFPAWLSPLVVKELRQGVRNTAFTIASASDKWVEARKKAAHNPTTTPEDGQTA